MATERFDYLVLGGGSGGVASARRAAAHGASVALVEGGRLGGTCVNVGCVPKKIMWNAASLAEALRDAPEYGFRVDPSPVDWAKLKSGRDGYVEMLGGIYHGNLSKEGILLVRGHGRLVDPHTAHTPHTVDVDGRLLAADHVLLATGGRPRIPDVPGATFGITSDGFFELPERPGQVAIAGAGYVAIELAGVLRSLGSEVTLFVRHDEPLRAFDGTLRAALVEHLEAAGVRLERRRDPSGLERDAGGALAFLARDGSRHGPFDCVLWAIGRVPWTAGMGLERAGVRTDVEGYVVVDDFQNTSRAGVYAVGDVTGRVPLTPVAIAAGRRLADRLFGGEPDARIDYHDVPTVVFGHPPIGTVGLSEEAARERHGDSVKIYLRRFVNLYHGLTAKKPRTTIKLVVVGEEERIVGIHVIGEGADEMIQGFAVALRMGARKVDLDRTVAIHPTAAEEVVTIR